MTLSTRTVEPPGVLAGHCLHGPCLVGIHTVKPGEECPLLASSLGYLLLWVLPWGPLATSGLVSPPLGLAPSVGLQRSYFFVADMALATAHVVAK
jgi:hypothetical protein